MTRFDWVRHLPPDALVKFVDEIVNTVNADGDLDIMLAAWESTAEIYADPELYKALTTPSDGDYGPVEPPQEKEKT